MANTKIVNGVVIDLTPEEEAQLNAERQAWIEANPPLTRFELSLKDLRDTRNNLLAQSDWIVTKAKETGTTIPTAWKTYRQALRDITENLTTVEEVNAVIFPTKP